MAGMLRNWWDRLNARPRLRDATAALTYLVIGLALYRVGAIRLSSSLAPVQGEDLIFLAALIGICAIATMRSSRPLLALSLGTVVTAIDALGGGSLGVILVFFDLVYCAVKYGSDRGIRIAAWIAVALAVATGAVLVILRPENPVVLIFAVQWALIISIAGAWGWNVRSERLRTRALMAEQHARATQQMRQRIAHDLHDLVSNQIAVAGLHVEAARIRVEREGIAAPEIGSSFDQAKRGTDQAHRQLRRLIAVLTTVDDLGEAEPDVAGELARLASLPPAGRALVWRGMGEPDLRGFLEDRSAAQAGILLRVLQELVANAVKHGRGDIEISMLVRGSGALVTVCNTFVASGAPERGSGIGITGAALLLDGTGAKLESGPDPEGEDRGTDGGEAGSGMTGDAVTGLGERQWKAVLTIE
ncbi:sensor histidine kinase [Leucobacter sp. GX24907]